MIPPGRRMVGADRGRVPDDRDRLAGRPAPSPASSRTPGGQRPGRDKMRNAECGMRNAEKSSDAYLRFAFSPFAPFFVSPFRRFLLSPFRRFPFSPFGLALY